MVPTLAPDTHPEVFNITAIWHAKLMVATYQLKFRLWHMASNQWLWSFGFRSSVAYFWK